MPKSKLPELLCPAGSASAFEAALNNGADAVYLGVRGFNARANAANFSFEELEDVTKAAHAKGCKIYLTLNTLVYDRELRDCLLTAEKAGNAGVDALIVADTGLCSVLLREFPELPLHASTQMSVHNAEAGIILRERGFSRAVLAREMSKNNISSFIKNAVIESEVFVHGALCVCHSGQCLFSSLVGGRSGNRGECAQPCRLPYGNQGGKSYPLSLKDLSLCRHVPELIDLGITSLKIEGRMKPAEYVAAVTSVWRRLLDEKRGATDEEERYLADVFSRSGFTDGYFEDRIDRKMLGVRTEDDKKKAPAKPLYGQADLSSREPVISDRARLDKSTDSIQLLKPENKRQNFRSAVFYNSRQLTQNAKKYFDLCYIPLDQYATALKEGNAPEGAFLPPVIYDSEAGKIDKMIKNAKAKGLKHLLISNVGHLHFAAENGLVPHGNFRLNVCNSESMRYCESLGFEDCILSPELTLPRIRDIGGRSIAVVYGRIPLMITEKCVGRECGDCRKCDAGQNYLVDRMGKKLPVLRVWKHRSEIFNCVPFYMSDKPEQLRDAQIRAQHYIFSNETPREVDRLISAFTSKAEFPLSGQVRRIPQK